MGTKTSSPSWTSGSLTLVKDSCLRATLHAVPVDLFGRLCSNAGNERRQLAALMGCWSKIDRTHLIKTADSFSGSILATAENVAAGLSRSELSSNGHSWKNTLCSTSCAFTMRSNVGNIQKFSVAHSNDPFGVVRVSMRML